MAFLISNLEELERKKEIFRLGGKEKIHILSDFDRTLTKVFNNGEKITSVVSILSQEKILSEEYTKKANEYFNKYHPIELDSTIQLEEKKKAMMEWWESQFKNLISSGLNKRHLQEIVNTKKLILRENTEEFIKTLNEVKIPLVIISSGGIGNIIDMILDDKKLHLDNVSIITNEFEWDSEGNAIKVKQPYIHVFNKDETATSSYPEIYNKIKDRKNIILLGDSFGDLGMATGFEYNEIIKIGFLNEDIEENLEKYKENFDIVITEDGNFEEINKLLREILDEE